MNIGKLVLGFIISFSLFASAEAPLECERALTHSVTLITPKNKYLSLDLPYEPAERLRKKIEALRPDLALQNRGEAHLTLLTPEEYGMLNTKLSRNKILEVARTSLKNDLVLKCVGMSQALIDGQVEKVFYIVVESDSVRNARKNLKAAFIDQGGLQNQFRPDFYLPHITLGFTLRDLHEADGAVKNLKSCVYPLNVI